MVNIPGWWWLEHDSIILQLNLGLSSSQSTFIFFRGVGSTTNDWWLLMRNGLYCKYLHGGVAQNMWRFCHWFCHGEWSHQFEDAQCNYHQIIWWPSKRDLTKIFGVNFHWHGWHQKWLSSGDLWNLGFLHPRGQWIWQNPMMYLGKL